MLPQAATAGLFSDPEVLELISVLARAQLTVQESMVEHIARQSVLTSSTGTDRKCYDKKHSSRLPLICFSRDQSAYCHHIHTIDLYQKSEQTKKEQVQRFKKRQKKATSILSKMRNRMKVNGFYAMDAPTVNRTPATNKKCHRPCANRRLLQ